MLNPSFGEQMILCFYLLTSRKEKEREEFVLCEHEQVNRRTAGNQEPVFFTNALLFCVYSKYTGI